MRQACHIPSTLHGWDRRRGRQHGEQVRLRIGGSRGVGVILLTPLFTQGSVRLSISPYKGRTPERTTFFSLWIIPGDNIQPLRLNSVLQSFPLSWEDTYCISGGPQHGRENGGGGLQTDPQAPNLGLRILNYDGVIATPASTPWEKQFRLSSTLLNRVGSRPGNLAGAGIIWWPIWGG